MQPAEIKKQVQKKSFLIDAFLYTASLTSGVGKDLVLKHSVTGHFLRSVVLELIIKMLYELDIKKATPFTHNLVKLFDDLNQETKDFLEGRFDEALKRCRQQFSRIKDEVEFHPLREVLTNNEKTVKNFKYDAMGVPTNSSADVAFYREVLEYIEGRIKELNV